MSLSWAVLDSTGWPWNRKVAFSNSEATAQIAHSDGRLEVFGGTPMEVRDWMDQQQEELKREYGIRTKAVVGKIGVLGRLLGVAAGVLLLLWRLVTGPRRDGGVEGRASPWFD